MRRPTLAYLGLLVLVVVLFYWKTLLTHQFTIIIGSEGVNMNWAWLHFLVSSIRDGRLPLWDPYEFAGCPFAGSMQPAVYYPLQLLFVLIPFTSAGHISETFFHQYLAFAHLLAAAFGFALLREMGRSRYAAFIGGCAFALSGLLVRMIWPLYIESCIWLPAIFLFLLRALRAQRRDRALLEASFCGFCLAMSILTGGMVFFVMQAICVVSAAVWYAGAGGPFTRELRQERWKHAGMIAAVALLAAAGLSAVQLLPASEYGKLTIRFIDGGDYPAAKKIPFERLVPGMWPQSIVSALFPAGFDGKIGGEEFFPFYIGVFPLFLAVIAVWKCWRHIWVRYLTGLAVLCFIYALGEMSPLYGVLYALVPMLWLTRAANRFFYLISFALAILAAFGLDELLDRSRASSFEIVKRFIKWIALACVAALVIPSLYNQLTLSTWNTFSLLLILASCAWLAWLLAHPAGSVPRFLLASFILFDLAAFNWIEGNKSIMSRTDGQMEQMISLKNAAGFVKAQPGLHRVRVAVEPQPNIGDVYGVESIWGGGATALTSFSRISLRDDLLNVRYTIRPVAATQSNPVFQDTKWKVYRNENAFPRAWTVHQLILRPSQDSIFDDVNRREVDLRTAAFIENSELRVSPAGPDPDTVAFRSWRPEGATLDANCQTDCLMVVSEMFYPGWTATINGRPATIYRVDGGLRGIRLSRGRSSIEFKYASTTFRVGAVTSLLTFLLFLGGWFFVWRKGKAVRHAEYNTPQWK